MRAIRPSAAMILAMSILAGTPTWAAKTKKTSKPHLEVYSATETEGGLPPRQSPAPAVRVASVQAPKVSMSYDPVPSDQRDSIAQRALVVEKLIRQHGRAYDYRVLTLRELQEIARSLGTTESKPVEAKAVSATPATAPIPPAPPTIENDTFESSDDASDSDEESDA